MKMMDPNDFVWSTTASALPSSFSLGNETEYLFGAHWLVPTITAIIYLLLTASANAQLGRDGKGRKPVPLHPAILASHSFILVIFSAICVIGISHDVWTMQILPTARKTSFADAFFELFCPQKFDDEPLGGRIFWWAYIFYLSKYYELLDTLFIVLKAKRVIALHLWHHMSVPPIMWAAFQGRLRPALIFVVILNGSVHTIMYLYYGLTALGVKVAVAKKMLVTRIQIVQFYVGVAGGSSFLLLWLRTAKVRDFAHIDFVPGCSGDLSVFGIGFLINVSFLVLFTLFFRKAYGKNNKKTR